MDDDELMRAAIAEAKFALAEGEVPVGCVIVKDGVVVARGRNANHVSGDGTAHAEMVALDALKGEHATNSLELYVTCEPCIMCAAALTETKLFKVVCYGCSNARFGGCGSVREVLDVGTVRSGVRAPEALDLLVEFYQKQNPYAPKPKPRRVNKRTTE